MRAIPRCCLFSVAPIALPGRRSDCFLDTVLKAAPSMKLGAGNVSKTEIDSYPPCAALLARIGATGTGERDDPVSAPIAVERAGDLPGSIGRRCGKPNVRERDRPAYQCG